MVKFNAGDAQTLKQAWQRYYFLGKMASTGAQVPSHASKIRLDVPLDRRRRMQRPVTAPVDASLESSGLSISQLGMQDARHDAAKPAKPPRKPKTKPR